jgi:hypothetical protein
METFESVFVITILLGLGIGLIAAIIGVFLFNNFDWWDKL